jgi:hypothetical protein
VSLESRTSEAYDPGMQKQKTKVVRAAVAAGLAGVMLVYEHPHTQVEIAAEAPPAIIRVDAFLGASTATMSSSSFVFTSTGF